jgi:hypothetical protein
VCLGVATRSETIPSTLGTGDRPRLRSLDGILLPLAGTYAGVDLISDCVGRERFAAASHASFTQTDGRSLPGVADSSVDVVFSLVHAEVDVLSDYCHEIARLMGPQARGFIHHSNIRSYSRELRVADALDARTATCPRLQGRLTEVGASNWDHWRARSVSADAFRSVANEASLAVEGQELVTWGGDRGLIDCFSFVTPRDSENERPTVVRRNPFRMAEARAAKHGWRVTPNMPNPDR